MIIPSIDIMDGHAVQLVGGEEKQIDAGDPRPIMDTFKLAGEVAVIDLDAALGQGSNAQLVEELAGMGRVRVGGGIRDVDTALDWLDRGVDKVILGTAATPEVLSRLPSDRVIAALDARHGEVVVEGWQTKTGRNVLEKIEELRPHVDEFMVTFVEREGRLEGTDLERVETLLEVADGARLTVAGGISTTAEIEVLHELGVDAQVGMALYTDQMHLADAIAAPLDSDRDDGLWPTVICDEYGRALGLAYSDLESLRTAIDERAGVYHSRSRGLWIKGETSGNTQNLLAIDVDCDADALRFEVLQHGDGFCHKGTWSCWGDDSGLPKLQRTLRSRLEEAPTDSYTRKLFENPGLLAEKVREEAAELAAAEGPDEVVWEAADLMYFLLARVTQEGVSLRDVECELDRRSQKLRRRDGTRTDEE